MFSTRKSRKLRTLLLITSAVTVAFLVVALMRGKMFIIVENTPLTAANYSRVFTSEYIWNDLLGSSSPDQGIFNFRTYLLLLIRITGIELGQAIILLKIILVIIAFIGFYKLLHFFNKRYFSSGLNNVANIIGSLFYTLNPSFLIGDHFWVGIQVGYYTLPMIIYLMCRIVAENKFVYLFPLAFLFSINNAGHFTFGGYEIILSLFILLIILLEKKDRKKLLQLLATSLLVFVILFASQASYVLGSLASVSEDAVSMTKASIDVPWSTATINNLSNGMGYTQLLNDYYLTGSKILDPLVYLTLGVLPVLVLLPLLKINTITNHRKHKKVATVAVGLLIVYLLTLICFASDSPLNFLRYLIASELPFGRIFRTWRVPEAIIAILTTMLVGISLSIVMFKNRALQNRYRHGIVIISVACLLMLALPILRGDINGPAINTPTEYKEINEIISRNNTDHGGVSLVPAFVAAYGQKAPLKPYWSPEMGMILEFGVYSMPERTLTPQNSTKDTYLYTSSEFYKNTSLLLNNRLYAMARIYALSNTTNVVLHRDMPSAANTPEIEEQLSSSPFWEKYSATENASIYKNLISTSQFRAVDDSNVAVVSGGFRSLARFFEQQQHSYKSNTEFIFIDQGISFSQLSKIKNLVSDKDYQQNLYDYLFAYSAEHNGSVIYPSRSASEYSIDNEWSKVTQKSVHQQEWQPYINRMGDYAWDNDYGQGFLATSAIGAKITIPNPFNSPINKLFVRYLASDAGGQITYDICGSTIPLDTRQDYGGFIWKEIPVNCSAPSSFTLTNIAGMNAISVISLYESKEYLTARNNSLRVLDNVRVTGSEPKESINLVPGNKLGTFEDSELWKPIKDVGEILKKADESTNSFAVERYDNIVEWSWLSSGDIPVTPYQSYMFSTSMSQTNSANSHIILEAIDSQTGNTRQLLQLPTATNGTTERRDYSEKITIPNGVEKVRVILNAGWALSKEAGTAATTFSRVKLSPLEEIEDDFDLNNDSSQLVSVEKINPTKIVIGMKYPSAGSTLISTSENYNPGWKAQVLTAGHKKEEVPEEAHIKINGYANGWLIDAEDIGEVLHGDGTIKIVLEYAPQQAFALGLKIVATTLSATLIITSLFLIRGRQRPRQSDTYFLNGAAANGRLGHEK